MSPRTTRAVLVAMMLSGGPALFALDLFVRGYLVESQPDDVRGLLGDVATRFAWAVMVGPLIGGIAGLYAYPRIYARQLARSRASDPAIAAQNADLTALMFAASMPQLPALLGDLSLMLGARLAPVVVSTTVSVLGVLVIATLGRRGIPGPPP